MTASSCLLADSSSASAARGSNLRRAKPEALGIDSAGILAFIDAVEQKVGGLHSFILVRRGQIAAEGWWAPYAPRYRHMLFSLSKSFTSTGVGLAVHEGHLTVDDSVLSFFKEEAPPNPDDNLRAMKVRHLLTMNTGHDKDATAPVRAAADGNWVRAFLSLPVEHAPGSKFVYNSAATYMCSAIVQKVTGRTLHDYLKPRLFEPLGIEGETWESCPRGINTGGWGLSVKTEDIARFGQLYLQRGKWNGRQLVPVAWVMDATSKQVSNGTGDSSDWTQGYGYQFWRCRHDAFRGDGAFGQYCVVMPEQDAVLAITSGIGDMQAVLNCVWDHLLPAIRPSGATLNGPHAALERRLSSLSVTPPSGQATSAIAARISGRTFRLDSNDEKLDSAELSFGGDRANLTIRGVGGEHQATCGFKDWAHGTTTLGDAFYTLGRSFPGKCAGRSAWTADDTFTAKLCFYETPFILTVACRFAGDQVTITRRMNVGFGPTERPTLIGRLA